jgi:cytochrome P450
MAITRPPGPRDGLFGLRLIGRIRADVLGFYCKMHQEYGDVTYMKLGPYHEYTVFHPDQIKEILVTKARHFIRLRRPIEVMKQWNGGSLLITEGEEWLRLRRLVQPAMQARRFGGYADAITNTARQRFDSWERREDGFEIEFEQAMTELTIDIIARTMFGVDLGSEAREIGKAAGVLSKVAIREMMNPFTLPDWLPLPGKAEKRWAMRTMDALVRRFVRERRQSGKDVGDLLSMLLLAVDEEGDGRGLTDEQARNQCMTMFLAGHDTTAAGMTWIGLALATNPEVSATAAAEVEEVLAGRTPTFEDLPQLGHVERVVKETLRHYPPAVGMFARQPTEDVQIGGWTVPRGNTVRILTYITHHDPRWFPDPDRFDPDRFAPERAGSLHPYAFHPFGAGPRACIGNAFAMMEMTLLTAMLLQRFAFALAPGQQMPALDPKLSLRPVGGLRLLLSPRAAVASSR